MKILDTNKFISERVKVKPVTNAEWDKARQQALFNDKTIACGTIVMFDNKSFGVYVDETVLKDIKIQFGFLHLNVDDKFYVVIIPEVKKAGYANVTVFDQNLNTYIKGWNIIRIYKDPLTKDELKSLDEKNFCSTIQNMAKSRKYTERT